jgi:DNA-binding IclR family transcriptional regulator
LLALAFTLSMPESVEQANASLRLVPAVERAVRLLDLLAAAGRPLPLAELTRELQLPKSSLHGLLATLVALGLARREPDGLFGLGLKPLQWAEAFSAQSDLLRSFDAHAGSFAELEPETVMLAVLEGDQVVYLSCRQGSRPLAVNFRVGGRFPASCTSSGKAMLASLPDAQVRDILGSGPLPRMTRHGVQTLDALQEQLALARTRGYAIDDEETAQGMQCFGAPIHAARQPNAVGAVAVSLIKAGLTGQRRDQIIAAITDLARRISTTLGG